MKEADEKKLRTDATRLFGCESIDATQDMLTILADCLRSIIIEHHKERVNSRRLGEARLLCQMIFSKALHLKKLLDGINFNSRTNDSSHIIDPTVIAVFVRNICETVATFHHIYTYPKDDEQRLIIYNLWVISGLKYRQKFAPKITLHESFKKQKSEAEMLNNLITEIKNTLTYKSLGEESCDLLKRAIKQKEYKVLFDDSKVSTISWEMLLKNMQLKDDIMGEMYTYFSLYAHPSNVSVFQFGTLFNSNGSHIHMANFNCKYAIMLISHFIGEYIDLFPTIRKAFNSQPLINQMAINHHLKFIRAKNTVINDTLSQLD